MTRSFKQKRYSTESGLSLATSIDQRKDCPHLRTAANETCASCKGMPLNAIRVKGHDLTASRVMIAGRAKCSTLYKSYYGIYYNVSTLVRCAPWSCPKVTLFYPGSNPCSTLCSTFAKAPKSFIRSLKALSLSPLVLPHLRMVQCHQRRLLTPCPSPFPRSCPQWVVA